jgi:hypothetical protein
LIGRLLGQPFLGQLRGVPRPALASAVLFGIAMWIGERVVAGSWFMLILDAGATFVLTVLIAGVLGMNRLQRHSVIRRLRRVGVG